MVLKKNVMVCFVLCVLAVSILLSYFSSRTEVPVESDGVTVSESTENTNLSVFDAFLEVEKEEVYDYIEKQEVIGVIEYSDFYYISTEENQFKVLKDLELDSYLRLYNYNPTRVSSVGELTPVQTKVVINYDEFIIGLVVYSLFIGIFGYTFLCYVETRKATQPTKPKQETAKKKEESETPNICFDDVYGVEGLKDDVNRIIDYLKNKDKYLKLGARPPKGIILYGPPGTGKTLIAKAIAGESGVPFYSAAGSDFVEMYVGVGAKRVRELYQKARKNAPCIVFIDEVDAIAHKRGNDNNSEDDKTINALLKELDGFDGSSGVITICATNRLDMLDSAFQRAGRFDLKLAVNLPDLKARYEILKIHSKNKSFSEDVDLHELAAKTPGFSGAELEALLNESALSAAGRNAEFINSEDLNEAFYKIILKGNKKGVSEINKVKKITAWHEAGHTLATKLLTDDKVPTVTIVSSTSGAGGVTFRAPSETGMYSKNYLKSLVKIMLAGRAAEEIFLGNEGEVTTGASEDIKQATNIIKSYVCNYGMGSYGMIDLEQFNSVQNSIIKECSELSNELYKEIKDLLIEKLEILNNIAKKLIEKETLVEKEIDEIIEMGCVEI